MHIELRDIYKTASVDVTRLLTLREIVLKLFFQRTVCDISHDFYFSFSSKYIDILCCNCANDNYFYINNNLKKNMIFHNSLQLETNYRKLRKEDITVLIWHWIIQ